MAIQDNDGFLHGKKGDNIYRRLNDKAVVSQAPKERKQTGKSKATGFEFGLASNTARTIRLPLGMYYLGLDGTLINRLNAAIRKALHHSPQAECERRDIYDSELSELTGLQFNRHAALYKILKIRPQVKILDNSTIQVVLPGFSPRNDLLYPKSSLHIGCTIRIAQYAFDFRKEFYIYLGSRETEITQPYFDGFDWNFDECLPPGTVALVCMSLHYHIQGADGERKYLNIREFSAAELIAAYRIPTVESAEETEWLDSYLPLDGYRGNEMLRNINPDWAW